MTLSIGETIATVHSSSIQFLNSNVSYARACVHDNTRMFARCTKAFFIRFEYDDEKVKGYIAYAYTKRVHIVGLTHSSTRTDLLAVL